jgi:hypothetical protein
MSGELTAIWSAEFTSNVTTTVKSLSRDLCKWLAGK